MDPKAHPGLTERVPVGVGRCWWVWVHFVQFETYQKKRGIPDPLPPGRHHQLPPYSWIRTHNPDINWEFGTLRWRSGRGRIHCFPTDIVVTGITIDELLLEDPSNFYQER